MMFAYRLHERQTMNALSFFTAREKEIYALSVRGMGCKQIASELGISPNTVKKYRSRLIQKAGASNMLELAGRMAGEKKQAA